MDPASDSPALPSVTQEEDMWILRVESNGKVQEYRCHSEVQARALAVLLFPGGHERTEESGSALTWPGGRRALFAAPADALGGRSLRSGDGSVQPLGQLPARGPPHGRQTTL